MRERVWLRWPLLAFTLPYGILVQARLACYERGWLARHRLPCRVVSVGNLTVGGTGKTPMVIAVVSWLQAKGQRVGVLSRGYRRRSREDQVLVSDGTKLLVGPDEAGDEPYLIARRCPETVVAVGADRYRLGRWVLDRFPLTSLVLDDGFQHLALHRDVNLLLVDASRPKDLEALLPAGRLREPLAGAARASALILTRVDLCPGLDAVLDPIRAATGREPDPILVRFRPHRLVDPHTETEESLGSLTGRSVLAFSGIGNAVSFRRSLEGLGVTLLEDLVYPDHHAYSESDVRLIRTKARHCGADFLVTTEKDAVKVATLFEPADRLRALRVETEIQKGRERLEQLLLGNDER